MITMLIEVPVTTDIDTMESTLQAFVKQIKGSWVWQGREVAGRRLLDVVVPASFDWQSLLPSADRDYTDGDEPIDSALQALIDTLGWRLVGCWSWDGISKDQTELDYSVEPAVPTGNIIRAVKRLFPEDTDDPLTDLLFVDVLNYMHDVVEHDIDGNEISRTRPTFPSEVHSWGWPPRT